MTRGATLGYYKRVVRLGLGVRLKWDEKSTCRLYVSEKQRSCIYVRSPGDDGNPDDDGEPEDGRKSKIVTYVLINSERSPLVYASLRVKFHYAP